MRIQRKWFGLACVGMLLTACEGGTASVGAGQADPDRMLESGMSARQTIEARALHMKDLGGSFKAVRDQIATETPNLALIQMSTQEVANAAQDLPSWFPAGTGPETGVEMRALAEVWSDAPGFATAANDFRTSASRMNELAQSGDLEALKEQTRVVRKSCGGCHDGYRAPPLKSESGASDS